jgi:hypothetical protein
MGIQLDEAKVETLIKGLRVCCRESNPGSLKYKENEYKLEKPP